MKINNYFLHFEQTNIIIKKLVQTFPVMLNNTVISLATVKRSEEGVTKNKDSRRVKKLVVDITTDTSICSM